MITDGKTNLTVNNTFTNPKGDLVIYLNHPSGSSLNRSFIEGNEGAKLACISFLTQLDLADLMPVNPESKTTKALYASIAKALKAYDTKPVREFNLKWVDGSDDQQYLTAYPASSGVISRPKKKKR